MPAIYPSLINADLLNLEATIKALDPYCAGYHIDIMDNHWVPNLTWGHQFTNAIAQATTKKIWVHLMVDNPESLIRRLILPADSLVSIHIESQIGKTKTLALIKENNWQASIAISPKTAIKEIIPFLPLINQALVMSVNPGYSGQEFMPSALDRIKELKRLIQDLSSACVVGVDGGIASTNIHHLIAAGADDLAIASAIFDHNNPVDNLIALKKLL
jgi:ribulose-phosphate 3-epimerase